MSESLVIIPTYNEKENIEDIIHAIFCLDHHFHLLIVDDNSPDGTAGIVKKLQKEYQGLYLLERKSKFGLGTAYIVGFKYALKKNYEFIFEMDADFSHTPADLLKLYKTCAEEGNDMAIGSRYISGINVVNWPMNRILMSYGASIYVQFITGIPIKDTTAGFKCYTRKVLETIDLDNIKFLGYAFQVEMKFLAWKYGFKIKEVPIIFTNRTKGTSKMSTSIFKEAILGVLQIKINSFFKKYHRV